MESNLHSDTILSIETRICTNCNIEQDMLQFNKARVRKDGTIALSSWCKTCIAKYKKNHYEENKEQILQDHAEYYQDNKDKILGDAKNWYQNNKERKKEYDKIRYEIHGDELRQQGRQKYYDNKEIYIARNRKYIKNKYQTDINYKLHNRVSSEIRKSLLKGGFSKNGLSILDFLPYSIEELKKHIEAQFLLPENLGLDGRPWMTWENWKQYKVEEWKDSDMSTWTWNLDHIIPQINFYYTTMDCQVFRDCWALSNLRPYSSKLNIIENDRK